MLLDETRIRTVAGKPSGKVPLDIPKASEVERRAKAKDCLAQALLDASEATGRRRETVRPRFGHNRRRLLEQLEVDGPVRRLASWKRLESNVDRVASELKQRR